MAVELRLGEICAGQLQDLVGLAQFANLALQLLDALLLGGGRTWPDAAVALALAHLLAQRLGGAADLAGDRLDRRPLRRVLVLGVEDYAHFALDNLGGKLRGLPHHGSILNRRSLLKIRGGSVSMMKSIWCVAASKPGLSNDMRSSVPAPANPANRQWLIATESRSAGHRTTAFHFKSAEASGCVCCGAVGVR